MDDDKLLEELRAQRELIRKHLDWIEQKIAEQEGSEKPDDQGSVGCPQPPSGQAPDSDETELVPPQTEDEPNTDGENDEEEQALQTYRPASGNDVTRAKIGCLVLFVLSTALFLFLLFGLPYLLD